MQHDSTKLEEQALTLIDIGDLVQAKALYEQICQNDSDNAEAWSMLGLLNGEVGDTQTAMQCLERALALNPDDPDGHLNISLLLNAHGEYQQALHHCELATHLDSNYAAAWTTMGGILGILGNFTGSEECCRRALALDAESVDACMNLANALLNQNRFEEAAANYLRVTAMRPDMAVAWNLLAKTYEQRNLYPEAVSYCQRALTLQPDVPETYQILGNALSAQDQIQDALRAFHQVIRLMPENSEAHANLGMLYMRSNQLENVVMHLREALRLEPTRLAVNFNLAIALHQLKRFDEAAAAYRMALQDDLQDKSQIHFNLGLLYQEQGNIEEAKDNYLEAVRLNPNNLYAQANLGFVLRRLGLPNEALDHYRQALKIDPNSTDILSNMANTLAELGHFDESAKMYTRILQIKPGSAETHLGLSIMLRSQGNFPAAEKHCREAIHLRPDWSDAHCSLATIYALQGHQDMALPIYEESLAFNPDNVEAYLGISAALMTFDRAHEATNYCDQALRREPNNIDAIALSATIAEHMGDMKRAYDLLKPVIDSGTNHGNIALAFAGVSKSVGRQDEAIELMERLLIDDHRQSLTSRSNLHFSLGKLYDAKGEYDKAFENYRKGNELKPVSFDTSLHSQEIDALIAAQSREILAGLPRPAIRSNRPIFVVGMVRSGTSLVEQILSSHPEVHGAGELPDIIHIVNNDIGHCKNLASLTQEKVNTLARRYLDKLQALSPDASRVVDKMPGNFIHLGLIEILFPDARIIHCKRDPMDSCLSAYFQSFSRTHPYSYNLANLGAFYRQYEKLMLHWSEALTLPILEIQYEELVSNQETVTRGMVEYCGLNWDDRCLKFHENDRYVATASYDQVRRPLYNKSAGRWKNYERHLEPLRVALQSD